VLVVLVLVAVCVLAMDWLAHTLSQPPLARSPAVLPLPDNRSDVDLFRRAKQQLEDTIRFTEELAHQTRFDPIHEINPPDEKNLLRSEVGRQYFDGIQDELALPKDERMKPENKRLPDGLKHVSPYHPFSPEQSPPQDDDKPPT
jgi:hypothetical protein